MMAMLLAACTGGVVSTPATGVPTADTGASSASATLLVRFEVFEADRDCFGIADWEVSVDYWSGWSFEGYSSCTQSTAPRRALPTYATTDGQCLRFPNPLQGYLPECDVDDPWIRPCEEVAGCCDLGDKGDYPTCSPDYTYQP